MFRRLAEALDNNDNTTNNNVSSSYWQYTTHPVYNQTQIPQIQAQMQMQIPQVQAQTQMQAHAETFATDQTNQTNQNIGEKQSASGLQQFNRAIDTVSPITDVYELPPSIPYFDRFAFSTEREVDKPDICKPFHGKLSAQCLQKTVIEGGCSDKGALALALSNPSPSDYIANIKESESVKIYNRVAKPPLNLDIFKQGQTSVATVLQEVKQLASNASVKGSTKDTSVESPLNAAARDLCIQSGTLKPYNFCEDIPDSTLPPYNVQCLQILFKNMGGTMSGTSYPSDKTVPYYNTFTNLGTIKHYWLGLVANLKAQNYEDQRNAMMSLFGTSPEKMIVRAPWTSGVEVFWFSVNPNNGGGWPGFLRRTIERDIPHFNRGDTTVIPQIGISEYASFLALTDVRSPNDFTTKFSVTVQDGFWIAANQPAAIDYYASENPIEDGVGFFANNQIQGITTYQSDACSVFTKKFPNITKFYYQNKGGGSHTFAVDLHACKGQAAFVPANYSLTCEQRAPYINYEINGGTMKLEDTRNPWTFSQFIYTLGGEYHTRSEELIGVPGGKGFIRLNNSSSSITMSNIAYQAWGGCNIAFRMVSMPVKDILLSLGSGSYIINIMLQPINGSTAKVFCQHNLSGGKGLVTIDTNIVLGLNQWYYVLINQYNPNSITIFIDTPANIIINKGASGNKINLMSEKPFYSTNGLYMTQGRGSACYVGVGAKTFSKGGGSSSFNFDVAFIHYFDQTVNNNDWVREANCDWIFTQFPVSVNNYQAQ